MKNDEIKEKLKLIDGFFNKAWACDLDEVYHAVIDIITNLQQQNEELKKNKLTPDELANLLNQELIKQRDDYKSRVEKAVEYIKNCPEYLWANVNTKVLLNILNGDDKE